MGQSTTLLPAVETETAESTTAAVIWLHGLGADGHDFAPITYELQMTSHHKVKFVFPHAPVRPVTINGGFAMRAWYDILGLEEDTRQDAEGLASSGEQIASWIDSLVASGIPSQRIVLGGFSQGGALALYHGLQTTTMLGGIVAFSCYLPVADTVLNHLHAANKNTPLLMAHGTKDNVVPYAWGERSANTLKDQGYDVTWHSYPMAHSVCGEQMQALDHFIAAILAKTSGKGD